MVGDDAPQAPAHPTADPGFPDPLQGGTRRTALVRALFEGLSEDDRTWVVDRIRRYRALAAADEVSEGRV